MDIISTYGNQDIQSWPLQETTLNDALDLNALDSGAASSSNNSTLRKHWNNHETSAASSSGSGVTPAHASSSAPPISTRSTLNSSDKDGNRIRNNDSAQPRIFSASEQKFSLLRIITSPLFWGFLFLWTIFSFTGITQKQSLTRMPESLSYHYTSPCSSCPPHRSVIFSVI